MSYEHNQRHDASFLKKTLSDLANDFSTDEIRNALFQIAATPARKEMTIISNAGLHPLPNYLRRGEVFEASFGNLNFENSDSVREEIFLIVKKTIKQVSQVRPTKIFLIPWGPAVLSSLIKYAIYRSIGIETVDVLYLGNGKYIDLEFSMRDFLPPNTPLQEGTPHV